MNLSPSRLRWNVPEVRRETAETNFKLVQQRVAEAARFRRENFEAKEAKVRAEIIEKEGRDRFNCKAGDALMERLKGARLRREERTKLAHSRRIEMEETRAREIRSELEKKKKT